AGLSGGKFGGVLLMILIGLVITMGIGSSFGTIPIIATIYCPLALELGFSAAATILIIGIAAGIGDAGSPASDSTLGPTAGLNADGQHNHIYDTCVPTFLFFNIPLIVFGVVFAMFL
ncbi:MAG: sodium:proton antiporter, partial [Campylobacter sp.]|nr:sodium:proton antiporter [Campylobacter sp.]